MSQPNEIIVDGPTVDLLESRFPQRPVKEEDSLSAIQREAGRQEVVTFLRALYEHQQAQPQNVRV